MKTVPFRDDESTLQHLVPYPKLTFAQVSAIANIMKRPDSRKVEVFQTKASRWTHTYVQLGKRQFLVSQKGKVTELNVTVPSARLER